ncbi:uncharacterized protein LOC131663690 [Phymastichus coffea]|uniref:uncharacterized protein LOC131663690 n=1 Tax=Phymastichus coffea TaxID=108790 RepID=UPI00273CB540|nr:uncharacterized protein LOC131663690 [Phymastichus coffea]XP_058790213.1 uncharacterized protein LOC131663690 [Phymastichus coffea]XP_058790214.1 uncharacterized protein LOC131663690 [Phymastichus coffea]
MVTKLFAASTAIILLGITTEATAQFRYGYGHGYNHHSHPYYPQQRPSYGSFNGYPQQNTYEQQLPPGVSVQEAEWVCKNPKTGDMMIIATDSIGSKSNSPVHLHKVDSPNNQAHYIQPQITFGKPSISELNPTYTTTEKSPIWQGGNYYQPQQSQVNPTTEIYTTIKKEQGPVWPSGNIATTKKSVYKTTPQPVKPIWSSNDGTENNNNGKKGFTVEDEPTTELPFYINPFLIPTTQKPQTTTTSTNSDDDGEEIEIVFG